MDHRKRAMYVLVYDAVKMCTASDSPSALYFMYVRRPTNWCVYVCVCKRERVCAMQTNVKYKRGSMKFCFFFATQDVNYSD